jgi:hypothetical protein
VAPIPDSVRAVLEGPGLAHLVTLEPNGRPQVSIVWVGLSIEAGTRDQMGLDEYVIIHGRARITEGGAAELLQRLAHTSMGPDAKFPPTDDPPPGYITHIAVERIAASVPGPAAVADTPRPR